MKWLLTLVFFYSAISLAQADLAKTEDVKIQTAIFSGGCFWCVEADFEKLPGVLSAESGYTGGHVVNPEYKQVSSGRTGHIESVRVTYDSAKLSYKALLDYFWHHIDPTVKNQQFCDVGSQYRTAIFYDSEAQRLEIEKSKAELLNTGIIKNIYTDILPASTFYPAEDYHQDYYKKNPIRYHFYRESCGRDARLKQIWGSQH